MTDKLIPVDVEDYLTEDTPINNQNYFILSYLLPDDKNNELQYPLFKVRGVYRTIEDCEKRIKKLEASDKYFSMSVCEVGKWGSLVPEEILKQDDSVSINYRESIMNTMVSEHKKNKDKMDEEFEERKRFMSEKAKYECSKEGQKLLQSKKENPVAVKMRVQSVETQIKELAERTKELTEILDLSKEQMNEFTEEEVEEAQKAISDEHKELFTTDDLAISRKEKVNEESSNTDDLDINQKGKEIA